MMRRGRRRARWLLLAAGCLFLALLMGCLMWATPPITSSREVLGTARERLKGDGAVDETSAPDDSSDDVQSDSDVLAPKGSDVSSDRDLERLMQEVPLPEGILSQARPTVTTREGDLQQVAVDLLTSYRDAQDCVLASSGYLDLFGSVWGCVVRGGDWVDICVVSEYEEGKACQVCVLRLERDEALEALSGTRTSCEG